jgi:DNA-binding IscR family transcriptional regulator
MAEIADAIEGQIFPMFCLEPSDHTCFQDSRCGLQGFWADVARAARSATGVSHRDRHSSPPNSCFRG